MARINTEGANISIDSVDVEFDNGVIVRVRMRIEHHWDGEISYEITLLTNPAVKLWGVFVYLEHDILKGQTEFRYSYEEGEDASEEQLIKDFERDLYEAILDQDYAKYFA